MASSSSSSSPSAYLAQAASSGPSSLRPQYETLSNLYDRKLYYQLLEATQSFFRHPDSSSHRYDLYQSFVIHWKSKVSDLSVAELAIAAAKELGNDAQKAHDFLVGERDQVEKDTPAHLLLSIEATYYKLLLGQLEQVKKDVDAGQKILNGYDAVETVVSAAYYRVAAEYYKAKAMYQQYYTTSLLYLACLPHNGCEDDLVEEDKVQRAHDLAIAAILGQGIWNFGELLLHPLLPILNNGPNAYLLPLLSSFSSGSLPLFDSLLPSLQSHPLLATSMPFLRQKICLMALVESVSTRPSSQRSALPFSVVARETGLPDDEVEHLCMKALSLGLIRGSLDQANARVCVEWVQPRVLEMDQLKALRGKLGEWLGRVKDTSGFVQMQQEGGAPKQQQAVTV